MVRDFVRPIFNDKKKDLLLILGENHDNILEFQKSMLREDISKEVAYLNFPGQSDIQLGLGGIPNGDGTYGFANLDEKRETLQINNLNFFEVMIPRYAITEDGRLFLRQDADFINHKDYEKIMNFLKDYDREKA